MSDSYLIAITLDDKFYREYVALASFLGLTPAEAMQRTLEGGSYVMHRLIRHFSDNPDLQELDVFRSVEGAIGKAVFMDLSACLEQLRWDEWVEDVPNS